MDTKKTCILVSLALFLISLSPGCGQNEATGKFTEEEMEAIPMATTDHLPEPSGGLVLSVYTETITAEEVILMIADELKSRAKLAKANGCDYPINYVKEDFVKRVKTIALNPLSRCSRNQQPKYLHIQHAHVLRPVGLFHVIWHDA